MLKDALGADDTGKLNKPEPTALVFPNTEGNAYTQIPTAFRKVVEGLGVNTGRGPHDRFTFHSLRHMAATRLARVLPLRGLMDVLGWSVAAMALRYSHTSQADMDAAAKALDSAFRTVPRGNVIAIRKHPMS
jgi:integrase